LQPRHEHFPLLISLTDPQWWPKPLKFWFVPQPRSLSSCL
jgi:hypothetical protein